MKLIISLFAMAALGTAIPACGKKEEPKPTTAEPTKATEPTKPTEEPTKAEADAAAPAADDAAPTAAEEVAATAPTEAADAVVAADDAAAPTEVKPYLKVTVAHHKAEQPAVTAEFQFTVVEASTDLTKLDTAKAVLEVDLNSFSSGIPDRDAHIKGPDFLDAATSAKATVTIDRVKAGAVADTFDATATVDLRGIKKEVPVTFKVVEKKADGTLVVEGETKGLNRADWSMTKTPEEVNVGATFDVALRAELKDVKPVVPATGTPEELFTKMTTHQEAVLGLIEANKGNAEAAAEAVEKYTVEHKDEIASLAAAMKNVPPEKLQELIKANEEKVKALAERGGKIMTENPDLMKNERFQKAMMALGGN